MKDLEFIHSEKAEFIYDVIAGVLSIIALFVVMLQFSNGLEMGEIYWLNIIDNTVYIIFCIDYVFRALTTKDRKRFFKHNIVDLIALIPFQFFIKSGVGSIFKLLRVVTYLLRLIGHMKEILFTNGFIYALGASVVITLLGSVGIYIFEGGAGTNVETYGDALWWSFVTVTTVGYGDISPATDIGRLIACVLMLTGIGAISMLTSTISTFFFSAVNKKNKKENLEVETLDISDLSIEKRKMLIGFYEFLKKED
ncbi:MAG: potassium channel family protein [Clostridium sp.]|uniref:potassium channel family protein n=1 Tax=Clostridium sp. TaxID=1506 RepID=UPI003F3DDF46